MNFSPRRGTLPLGNITTQYIYINSPRGGEKSFGKEDPRLPPGKFLKPRLSRPELQKRHGIVVE